MSMRRARKVVMAMSVTLVLAACGGDGSGDGSGGSSDGDGATIRIADTAFDAPDSVAVGTTVTVTNEDGVSHTFTSEDDLFDSESISPGGTFEFTFEEAGEFTYFCKFHPQMTGTLVVEG